MATIRTNPPGAKIYDELSGSVLGLSGTACKFELHSKPKINLTCDGYDPVTIDDTDFYLIIQQGDHVFPAKDKPEIVLNPNTIGTRLRSLGSNHFILLGLLALASVGAAYGAKAMRKIVARKRKLELMAASADPSEGSLVMHTLGNYRLVEVLGEGGMGVVYRAVRNDKLDFADTYACKVIGRQYTEHTEFLQRFKREIKIYSELNHPNIVKLFDYGEEAIKDGETRMYMVMEEIRGMTLNKWIPPGGLPPQDVLVLLEQMVRGISYAHGQGVVHRDLKPDNIMITDQGQIKIMDFGLARELDAVTKLTQTGTVMGTPTYMSPEQIAGDEGDDKIDQYSLGIIIFELLTGDVPFKGGVMTLMHSHLSQPPPLIHEVKVGLSPKLSPTLNKMLAKDPLQRYRSVDEALDALRRVLLLPK